MLLSIWLIPLCLAGTMASVWFGGSVAAKDRWCTLILSIVSCYQLLPWLNTHKNTHSEIPVKSVLYEPLLFGGWCRCRSICLIRRNPPGGPLKCPQALWPLQWCGHLSCSGLFASTSREGKGTDSCFSAVLYIRTIIHFNSSDWVQILSLDSIKKLSTVIGTQQDASYQSNMDVQSGVALTWLTPA